MAACGGTLGKGKAGTNKIFFRIYVFSSCFVKRVTNEEITSAFL